MCVFCLHTGWKKEIKNKATKIIVKKPIKEVIKSYFSLVAITSWSKIMCVCGDERAEKRLQLDLIASKKNQAIIINIHKHNIFLENH